MGVKKGGRPQKFNEVALLEIVKEYVNTKHEKGTPIKKTKLAKDLKDKGLNIVYQDLSRYQKIKKFIDEYNNSIGSESKIVGENLTTTSKNVGGRPRKFNEDELLTAVKGYVKSLKRAELIKPTRVAKHFQNKGIKITYQDLSRYKEVKKFIEGYNKEYKETLFSSTIHVDLENQLPVFEHIDTDEFFKRNKTSKDIENALVILNQTNEKLVAYCEKLQNKIIAQNEKNIQQSNEIEKLNSEIELLKYENKKSEENLMTQNRQLKENILIKARKMAMYEEFIHKYHYRALAEYATNLEQGCSNEHLAQLDGFFDEEKYLQGDFKLKDIAGKYASLSIAIDNIEREYLDEVKYNLKLLDTDNEYVNNLSGFIEKEGYVDSEKDTEENSTKKTKIDELDLSIEDIDSSLSFIDEI